VIAVDMPAEAAFAMVEEQAAVQSLAPTTVPDHGPLSARFTPGERYRDVSDAAWSPDGQWVAEVGGGLVQIWDPLTRTVVHSLRDPERRFHSVHFARSRDRVLVTAHDGSVIRWHVATARQEVLVSGDPARDPSNPRRAGELHSRWLVDVSAGASHAVIVDFRLPDVQPVFGLWDLGTGVMLHEFEAGNHAAFSPDGSLLAVTYDLRALVWDVKENVQVAITSRHEGLVASLAWTEDGRLVTNDHKKLHWWHPGTGKLLETLDLDLIIAAALSPRGHYAVLFKPNTRGGVRVGYNLTLVHLTSEQSDAEDQIRSAAFRDRPLTAAETEAMGGVPTRVLADMPTFEMWGRLSTTYGFPVEPMVRFAPLGEYLLIREQKDQLHVWSVQSRRDIGYLRPREPGRALTVHVHGRDSGSLIHLEDVDPQAPSPLLADRPGETFSIKSFGEPWSFLSLHMQGGVDVSPDRGSELVVSSLLRNGRRLWLPARAGPEPGWEHTLGVSGGLGYDAGARGISLRMELSLTHEAGQARRPAPSLRIPGRFQIVTDVGVGAVLGARQGLDLSLSSRFDPFAGVFVRAGHQWHPGSGMYYTMGVQSGWMAHPWIALGLAGASVGAALAVTALAE
jgi:hypothetical protein